MVQAAVGHSEAGDAVAAAEEVILQCRSGLAGTAPRALLVFASVDLDHAALLARLTRAFPGAALVGCTTDGEASSALGFREGSLAALALAGVEVGAALGRDLSGDPRGVAAEAARTALARCGGVPRAAFVTPESLTASGEAILAGVSSGLSDSLPVLGGLAGDQVEFTGTRQFFGGEALRDACPVLVLGGDVAIGHGVASGWTPTGRRGRVTCALGHVVKTIDDAPALAFFRSYLGPDSVPSGEFPLAVFTDDGAVLRAPLHADPESGSVTFFGDVPEGAEVSLSQTCRERIVAACADSVEQALAGLGGARPAAALIFSCAGRRHHLGSRTGEEIAAVRARLPAVPVCGFYAYAELAPPAPGRPSCMHNETFVSAVIGAP